MIRLFRWTIPALALSAALSVGTAHAQQAQSGTSQTGNAASADTGAATSNVGGASGGAAVDASANLFDGNSVFSGQNEAFGGNAAESQAESSRGAPAGPTRGGAGGTGATNTQQGRNGQTNRFNQNQVNQLFRQQQQRAGQQGGAGGGAGSTRFIRPSIRLGFVPQVRAPRQLNAGLQRRFAGLSARISRIGETQAAFSGVTIQVADKGAVTLSGTVDSGSAKRLAANLLRMEPGVRSITNLLNVAPAEKLSAR